jgi:hypothetical protein
MSTREALGFEYEFRNGRCEVTRVEVEGPAREAGMRVRDEAAAVAVAAAAAIIILTRSSFSCSLSLPLPRNK